MIKFLKNLFKGEREVQMKKKVIRFDISDCEFLQLSDEEQKNKLVSDGYFAISKVFSHNSGKAPIDFIPEEYRNSQLPMEVNMDFKFSVDFNNLIQNFKPTEQVVIESFEHFEVVLKTIIAAFKEGEHNHLNKLLTGKLESEKKAIIHAFYQQTFLTFNKENNFYLNHNNYLPEGVDKTNLLSKTYLVERDKKRTLLAQDFDLIKMHLYCPNLLKSRTIHIDFPNLSRLVDFCGRRDLMIELNEQYQFEQNHPYTFIHSNGLVFQNYSGLFANEIDFDWTIELLMSQDTLIPPKFYHRLADTLFQEKAFLLSSPFTEFTKLINNGFSESLTRIRPSENTSDDAQNEINEMKISLNQYRADRNK